MNRVLFLGEKPRRGEGSKDAVRRATARAFRVPAAWVDVEWCPEHEIGTEIARRNIRCTVARWADITEELYG